MAWIRSQDKHLLLNVDAVRVELETLYGETPSTGVDASGWYLGIFPTNEAALAELDAIERWLSKSNPTMCGDPGVYQISEGEQHGKK